jgi:hypothetical protein
MSYSEFAAIMGKVGAAKGKEYLKRWISEQDSVVVEVKNPAVTQLKESHPAFNIKPVSRPRRLSPLYDPEMGYPVDTMLRNPQMNVTYRPTLAPIFMREGSTIRRASVK